ncbi:MAG TPA: 16S rRNA (cytidine(1402)-2'-O)-methyltransferase [Candidatus Krumholzibacteria bacterium]|mgnify:CR=1 FL=1|nr:16S rRNA (cytidine(1402)-2'-O)-methyltransferase [Candidatus Krumholzibacteria bacterium]HRX52365.1 16S rRNA (cytidine(1402)-2'-O)-methyltransferase [Candidatus Krumholzibacteria bacterium]
MTDAAVPLPTPDLPAGSCWLVATPIGNLDDVSLRALAVLGGVDLVLAEDTRRTRILLTRYGLKARLEAFHDHNKERQAPKVVERLRAGERVALVSDAGMPAVADPGFVLVRALREAGLPYSVVPGPSSVLAALVLSGLPTDRFLFAGYPPRKSGRLRTFLSEALTERGTVVMLESIHRIRKTLEALQELAPDREAAVVREITKVHEEVLRGTPAELLIEMDGPRLKGELVLLLRGAAD